MFLTFSCVCEEKPGEKWQQLFQRFWPSYKKWYLSEGYVNRPGYLTCRTKLHEFMPELEPVYEELTQLAGGGDIESRFLSLYCPPPYLSGCTQFAWNRNKIALVRNYDYHPDWCEGVLLYSNWLRPVIGMSDCCWGLLDGMNDAGLAVSLTFGGRKITTVGFGVPLILRYICETCTSTLEACAVIKRIPVHMPYNITIIDALGTVRTVFLCPGEPTQIIESGIGTNHQHEILWKDYADFTGTVERHRLLGECLHRQTETLEDIEKKFLKPPLRHKLYEKGFGTLYTSIYYPETLRMKLAWPTKDIQQSFDEFQENEFTITFYDRKRSSLVK